MKHQETVTRTSLLTPPMTTLPPRGSTKRKSDMAKVDCKGISIRDVCRVVEKLFPRLIEDTTYFSGTGSPDDCASFGSVSLFRFGEQAV
mgnify:CR=1 FL=1|jgi:hypothetical protein